MWRTQSIDNGLIITIRFLDQKSNIIHHLSQKPTVYDFKRGCKSCFFKMFYHPRSPLDTWLHLSLLRFTMYGQSYYTVTHYCVCTHARFAADADTSGYKPGCNFSLDFPEGCKLGWFRVRGVKALLPRGRRVHLYQS